MNGYVCFWKGQRFEVYAETPFGAQQKLKLENPKIKRTSDITVVIAERAGGIPVVHSTSSIG